MWLFTENVNVIIQRNIREGIYTIMCNYSFFSYFHNYTNQSNCVKKSHMFFKRFGFTNTFNICGLAFIEYTVFAFFFIFSHINIKKVKSLTPSFMTHFLEFIILRIISPDIIIHILNTS